MEKPAKPTPDFPLFPHNNGQWAKKIANKLYYFGPWDDPQAALLCYSEMMSRNIPTQKKPVKPHPDFPLYPHASGQWAKKVRYKTRFFGPWDDPQGALRRWLDQRDDLLAGREPYHGGITVKELVDKFIVSKESLAKSGDLSRRHLEDCKKIGEVVNDTFRSRRVEELGPSDFEKMRIDFAKRHGTVALAGDVTAVRTIFNFAFKQRLIDKPVNFGEGFKKPSAASMRKARNAKGTRMFQPNQLRLMLQEARPQLRAMILLAINCGFGNNDCALLKWANLDLKNGWVTYPRPKTGVNRRCKLWPETVAALTEFKTTDYVFVTRRGNSWTAQSVYDNPISREMTKLLRKLKIYRPGLSFYALRHTFETIAGESRDQAAVDYIMGHVPKSDDMSAVYRERMLDKRLFRVARYVRNWLKPALAFRPLQVGTDEIKPSPKIECDSVAACSN
jgi:integrase